MSTLATTNLKNASSGSNNIVLNTDGTTTIAAPSNIIKSGTAVASTSGVAIDFNGLPSWVKRVTVMFNGVSGSGTSSFLVQLGTSGGIEATGYAGAVGVAVNLASSSVTNVSTGFGMYNGGNLYTLYGNATIALMGSNLWSFSFAGANGNTGNVLISGGTKTLSGVLDRIRITTVNGTDTFDAGSINILWEG